ncbi:MAG: DUF2382 domain-containing protein [Cyanobacteria bacterium J06581_3]
MALYRISDRYPNYQDIYFNGSDLKGMSVYSAENQDVGKVKDLLIDDSALLRYLVVDLHGTKQVLLSVRSCARTTDANVLYVRDLDSEDIGRLATYRDGSQENTQTFDAQVSIERPTEKTTDHAHVPEPVSVSLYEERLSTHKQRVKTGEVKISKRIMTETTNEDIPVQKEKIVIEIESIYGGETKIDFDDAEVAEDGSINMGIYEERTKVCRQVVPYQNVSIKKQVVEDIVNVQQTLHREELTVNPDGLAHVDWVES